MRHHRDPEARSYWDKGMLRDIARLVRQEAAFSGERHLRMHPETWMAIQTSAPAPVPIMPMEANRQHLYGLPVIVDEGETPGEVTLRVEHTIAIDTGRER